LILAQLSGVNIERLGRRKMFLISTAGMICALCFVMGLSAGYTTRGNTAMGIAAIPFLFIFYGFYDIAWTPVSRTITSG
jgi:MFS family permease